MVEEVSTDEQCSSCARLKQELEVSKKEQTSTLKMIKEKIISTDKLIKKYQKKCDDFEKQGKVLTDLTKKYEECKRNASDLQEQLSHALEVTEPQKKNITRLIQEKFINEEKIMELKKKNFELEGTMSTMESLRQGKDDIELERKKDQQAHEKKLEKEKERFAKLQADLRKVADEKRADRVVLGKKSRELTTSLKTKGKLLSEISKLKDQIRHLKLQNNNKYQKMPVESSELSESSRVLRSGKRLKAPPTKPSKKSSSFLSTDNSEVLDIFDKIQEFDIPALSPLPIEHFLENSSSSDSDEQSCDDSLSDLGDALEMELENQDNGNDTDSDSDSSSVFEDDELQFHSDLQENEEVCKTTKDQTFETLSDDNEETSLDQEMENEDTDIDVRDSCDILLEAKTTNDTINGFTSESLNRYASEQQLDKNNIKVVETPCECLLKKKDTNVTLNKINPESKIIDVTEQEQDKNDSEIAGNLSLRTGEDSKTTMKKIKENVCETLNDVEDSLDHQLDVNSTVNSDDGGGTGEDNKQKCRGKQADHNSKTAIKDNILEPTSYNIDFQEASSNENSLNNVDTDPDYGNNQHCFDTQGAGNSNNALTANATIESLSSDQDNVQPEKMEAIEDGKIIKDNLQYSSNDDNIESHHSLQADKDNIHIEEITTKTVESLVVGNKFNLGNKVHVNGHDDDIQSLENSQQDDTSMIQSDEKETTNDDVNNGTASSQILQANQQSNYTIKRQTKESSIDHVDADEQLSNMEVTLIDQNMQTDKDDVVPNVDTCKTVDDDSLQSHEDKEVVASALEVNTNNHVSDDNVNEHEVVDMNEDGATQDVTVSRKTINLSARTTLSSRKMLTRRLNKKRESASRVHRTPEQYSSHDFTKLRTRDVTKESSDVMESVTTNEREEKKMSDGNEDDTYKVTERNKGNTEKTPSEEVQCTVKDNPENNIIEDNSENNSNLSTNNSKILDDDIEMSSTEQMDKCGTSVEEADGKSNSYCMEQKLSAPLSKVESDGNEVSAAKKECPNDNYKPAYKFRRRIAYQPVIRPRKSRGKTCSSPKNRNVENLNEPANHVPKINKTPCESNGTKVEEVSQLKQRTAQEKRKICENHSPNSKRKKKELTEEVKTHVKEETPSMVLLNGVTSDEDLKNNNTTSEQDNKMSHKSTEGGRKEKGDSIKIDGQQDDTGMNVEGVKQGVDRTKELPRKNNNDQEVVEQSVEKINQLSSKSEDTRMKAEGVDKTEVLSNKKARDQDDTDIIIKIVAADDCTGKTELSSKTINKEEETRLNAINVIKHDFGKESTKTDSGKGGTHINFKNVAQHGAHKADEELVFEHGSNQMVNECFCEQIVENVMKNPNKIDKQDDNQTVRVPKQIKTTKTGSKTDQNDTRTITENVVRQGAEEVKEQSSINVIKQDNIEYVVEVLEEENIETMEGSSSLCLEIQELDECFDAYDIEETLQQLRDRDNEFNTQNVLEFPSGDNTESMKSIQGRQVTVRPGKKVTKCKTRPPVCKTKPSITSINNQIESHQGSTKQTASVATGSPPSITDVLNDSLGVFSGVLPVLDPLPPSPKTSSPPATDDHHFFTSQNLFSSSGCVSVRKSNNEQLPSEPGQIQRAKSQDYKKETTITLSEDVKDSIAPKKRKKKKKKKAKKNCNKFFTTRPAFLSELQYTTKALKHLYANDVHMNEIIKRLSNKENLSTTTTFAAALMVFQNEEDYMPTIIQHYGDRNRLNMTRDRQQSKGYREQSIHDQLTSNREQTTSNHEQSTVNREQVIHDRGQSIHDRGQSINDRGQSILNRGQPSNDCKQKTHVHEQMERDGEQLIDDDTCLMSSFEQRVIELLKKLEQLEHLKGVSSLVMTYLSKAILYSYIKPCKEGPDKRSVASYCRIMCCLCRQEGDLSRMRILCYDIMRQLHSQPGTALYLLTSIAAVWPSVLSYTLQTWTVTPDGLRFCGSSYQPLLSTIHIAVAHLVRVMNWVMLGNIIDWLCSWKQVNPGTASLQELFDGLVKLMKDPTFAQLIGDKDGYPVLEYGVYEVIKSLELLACVHGWAWLNNVLIRGVIWDILSAWANQTPLKYKQEENRLTSVKIDEPSGSSCDKQGITNKDVVAGESPVSTRGQSGDVVCEPTVVATIRLLGLVCRLAIQQHQKAIPHVVPMLLGLLSNTIEDSKITFAVQLATAYTLLEVSPWQPQEIALALESWKVQQLKNRSLPDSLMQGLNGLQSSLNNKHMQTPNVKAR